MAATNIDCLLEVFNLFALEFDAIHPSIDGSLSDECDGADFLRLRHRISDGSLSHTSWVLNEFKSCCLSMGSSECHAVI